MKKLRWQFLVVALTLVVVAVLLLTQQSSVTTNPILPQPASGGIYTEALVGSLGRLNPLFDLNSPADRTVDRLLFNGLLLFDSLGKPQADLAESWGVSADGTIYNVTLRGDAVWHDGAPVTSDDVIFTLGLLRSPFSAVPPDVRSLWDGVQVTRLNEKNIKFVLTEPFVPFLDYLTFGILPKHLLETIPAEQLVKNDFNWAPVGSGPYKFEKINIENGKATGVVLTIAKNTGGKAPFIEQIVYRYYPTAQAALAAYKAGEVLGISNITQDILASALAEKNLSLYSSRLPRVTMVLFNLGDKTLPFFQDKNVRNALLLGLNRQYMVDTLLQGQGIVANSPILPSTWAYYAGINQTAFDPDAAVAMLKTAGYVLPASGTVRVSKDNVSLSFTMEYPDDGLHAQLAQAIQQNWADIGVEVKLKAVSYDSLLKDYLTPRTYQAALVDLDMSRSYDPDPYPFWHQAEITGGQNYSQWDNRSASEYIEQARVVADPGVRLRLYRNFQVIFAREMPALLLYYPVFTFAVDQRVQGVQAAPLFEPADRFNYIQAWYLVTKRALDQTAQPTVAP